MRILTIDSSYIKITIQDDCNIWQICLWREIGGFYIGNFLCHGPRAIEHAQIETKWQILYWQYLYRTAQHQY